MKRYINREDHQTGQIETIEGLKDLQCSYWDFRALLVEYQISDQSAYYYISQRATKDFYQNSWVG